MGSEMCIRDRYKAKGITPSIAWRREAWKEEALDDLPSKDEKRAIVMQSDEHWNRLRGNVGETSERRDRAHSLWAFPSA